MRFSIYSDAITDGLEKLKKYYSCFNKKLSYVLALGVLLLTFVLYMCLISSCFF